VVTIAADRVSFPLVDGSTTGGDSAGIEVAAWERWNDYGIGLLRKGSSGSSKGELRQATEAFTRVEALGRPDGPLNLARVCLKEGRLDEAADALHRAAAFDPPAPPWSVAWFTGLVNEQNGYLDEAIRQFKLIADTQFEEARARGFDFSRDYRVLNEIGVALFERSRAERGAARKARRESLLAESRDWFLKTLKRDPENVTAHYKLALIYAQLGDAQLAAKHRALHMTYKPDDNASERTVAMHRRRNAAADHAAEAVVIYDLQRSGAVGLASPGPVTASRRLASAHE
jgi:tetratricopeptide (TPR) repeat protein